METAKVIEWVDIRAPRQEVFDLVVLDVERRMQLSPLWGVARLEAKSADFPAVGSTCRFAFVDGSQPSYEAQVIDYQPLTKLAYRLDIDRQTVVSWTFQQVKAGTRILYCEEFLLQEEEGDEFVQSIREVVRQWLQNIRRYAELHERWWKRILKMLLDRFYLRLRPEQRRAVATVLFIHVVGFIAFLMAVIALGFASLLPD